MKNSILNYISVFSQRLKVSESISNEEMALFLDSLKEYIEDLKKSVVVSDGKKYYIEDITKDFHCSEGIIPKTELQKENCIIFPLTISIILFCLIEPLRKVSISSLLKASVTFSTVPIFTLTSGGKK
jgi:hypothetical protein